MSATREWSCSPATVRASARAPMSSGSARRSTSSFEENVEDAGRLLAMLQAIDSCPAPVVCRVHGFALGGGSGLVACADIVVASPDAVFGFTEVKLGIIPAVISPYVLAKIGSSARRVFTTGERFGAETALRIGLVDEVAEDAEAEVERLVGELLTSARPLHARRSGWCWNRRRSTISRRWPRECERATRARRACARSWTSVRRTPTTARGACSRRSPAPSSGRIPRGTPAGHPTRPSVTRKFARVVRETGTDLCQAVHRSAMIEPWPSFSSSS